jgi:uncharacterized protein YndB with AHSA1/START domain
MRRAAEARAGAQVRMAEDHDPERDLVMTRRFEAPRHLIWRAWTEPQHLMQWFTPAPWRMLNCQVDLRPGGALRWTMRSPQGEESTHEACYLEIVENERLVWTDALGAGFRPLPQPFITVAIYLDETSESTQQVCRVLHKDAATRQIHLDKGFEQGWGACLDQLAEVVGDIES